MSTGIHSVQEAPRERWEPSRIVVAVSEILSPIVLYAGGGIAAVLCFMAWISWFDSLLPVALLLIVVPLFFTIFVHEYGHVLGASLAGMCPMHARVMRLEFLKRARGWRVRWSPVRMKVSGFVMAYPLPGVPLRSASMLMISSGPLANLLVGAFLSILFVVLSHNGWTYLIASAAVMNVAIGLANLFPTSRNRPSDGYLLWTWMRGRPEEDVGFTYVRLMGLSVSGTTADRLPAGDVQSLRAQPMPMPLVADWIALKSAQNLGDWATASDTAAAFDEKFRGLSRDMQEAMGDLSKIVGAEAAFSQSMLHGDASHVRAIALDRSVQWFAPHLAPRLKALEAALAARPQECAQWLAVVECASRASVDKALAISESRIRAAIEAIAPYGTGPRAV